MSKLTNSEAAVRNVLERIVESRNFSWYMWGTETMALCMEAEAERLGITREELQKQIHQRSMELDEYHKKTDRKERTEAEVVVLRRENKDLERRLARESSYGVGDYCSTRLSDDTDALSRVETLIIDADIRGQSITTEQLRSAIAGEHVFL